MADQANGGHGNAVVCLAFSSDGLSLASGSYDRTVRLWDVAAGTEKGKLEGKRETLLQMIEAVPTIRAIKDWAGNVQQHEIQIRDLQSHKRPVNVLTTHSAWLFSSLVLGCNGLLSGSGSVIPDLQAALFRAVQRDDLAEARRLNDRIYPLARVFYAEPWADMHNRMKEALVLMGKLPRAVVRPPLVKLARAEIDRIRAALIKAGLLDAKAGRDAA